MEKSTSETNDRNDKIESEQQNQSLKQMLAFNNSDLQEKIAEIISQWRKENSISIDCLTHGLTLSRSAIDQRLAGKVDFSFQEVCKILWLCSKRYPTKYKELIGKLSVAVLELILKREREQFYELTKASDKALEELKD